jgi:hypothetical protein
MAGQQLKIKGQNFRTFIGEDYEAAVVEATSCQVTVSGNMEDATTKDSEGGYTKEQMVSKQWSVSVDSVDASVANLRALITRFNSDSYTYVGWDQTSTTAGEMNRTAVGANFARSGLAILNDLSIQADNRATIQVSCQYQGSGAIS